MHKEIYKHKAYLGFDTSSRWLSIAREHFHLTLRASAWKDFAFVFRIGHVKLSLSGFKQ